jgi:hypothetical protein
MAAAKNILIVMGYMLLIIATALSFTWLAVFILERKRKR